MGLVEGDEHIDVNEKVSISQLNTHKCQFSKIVI